MPMSVETWLEKVRADRPPLTAAQVALLRPILAPVIPHVTCNAAPAAQAGAAPAEPEPHNSLEGPQ
jgi:hypothetical protein